ncbi:hypothetical protein EHI8A_116530 [Entamoeba histolytica HM-1:IMSS-B]|uniref:Uncharacterized protein n=6 Tax=Entamoeba histolytica TaxID=5759 RepID=C4M0A7_ENTH1|nr:hypothetical protein EHI_005140 [Entamoeba histolytica HM-1:IMSS]EMD47002.1 Hypothetical protein EHI5A_039680 [Entamoeba histolytica KU27]EMH77708.1 hypothetical protein EHI8A_116530 [Entamoeba histolytica HM-1:IMSS-B]EMS16514.1 hypothetical protein KM1_174790 [Entamoeba histolytica HM-3:IMSS]ENY60456.1 hypothetical protein EHI7A_097260 [Entamoeba histolytica HM-1:IMSS-A]GAT94584.1 hypothetical protein CL6EHI_005140 [Entamoeba histolytica]|eukprot:XP_652846.1 hypothetical protein EHI_005140 [Entamoeba histolytica HM-1:IMSS]
MPRRIVSSHQPITINEPKPTETEKPIEEKKKSETQTIVAGDFELFEDKGIDTKVIAPKKHTTTKPTKRDIAVQKEVTKLIETGKISQTKPVGHKTKYTNIWGGNSQQEPNLSNLKMPSINPKNPMWHPERKFVKKLTNQTRYKLNGVIGPMKAKKLAMDKKGKK